MYGMEKSFSLRIERKLKNRGKQWSEERKPRVAWR